LKPFFVVLAFSLLLSVPTRSTACSLVSCGPKDGDEMRPDFVVKVSLADIPLAKVSTRVAQFPGDKNNLFSGVTGADGTVRIQSLPPGEYWLESELLGISAGGVCFHINSHPSRKAKKLVTYEWGDLAPTTRQVTGRVIDPAPGEGAAFLQNIIKHVTEPIGAAELELEDPLSGAIHTTVSDNDGRFSFGDVPSGTYVLHVEGGATPVGHELEPTDLLIRVTDTASRNTLLLERSGGSTCGGPYLILEWPYKAI
jgi:hypothetical protein